MARPFAHPAPGGGPDHRRLRGRAVKIEGLIYDEVYHGQRARDLQQMIARPLTPRERVCPGCEIRCPECGSNVCTCGCVPGCPDAPRHMSSDPDENPVEPNIVPLVFALNALGACAPCWSCEGHVESDGRLIRAPHVWFYTRSMVHLSLINHFLFRVRFDKLISREWQVRVVDWGQTSDSAFSLEPLVSPLERVDLPVLHNDVRVIAEGLVAGVRDAAQHYLGDLDRLETARAS